MEGRLEKSKGNGSVEYHIMPVMGLACQCIAHVYTSV